MTKTVNIRVSTLEGTFNLKADTTSKGRDIFDRVVKCIGLEEFWYFGLSYETRKKEKLWIHMDKKILDHDLLKRSPVELIFKVKYYPEDPAKELITSLAVKYFYLQVQTNVVADVIYCQTDRALLLAALDAQARYGNYDKSVHQKGYLFKGGHSGISERINKIYGISKGTWEKTIIPLHEKKKNLDPHRAGRMYIEIAQDLHGYGFKYYPVKVSSGFRWTMGIAPFGLHFYSQDEGFKPIVAFHWGEIKTIGVTLNEDLVISFKGSDRSLGLKTSSLRTSKHIIRLCKGSCDLYIRRNSPEPEEVLQIRALAATAEIYNVAQECISLKHSQIVKENDSRRKEIQTNIKQFEKEFSSQIAELNRLETLEGKKREKTFKSFTDWIQLEVKRRSLSDVTSNLEFDDWIRNGLQLDESHWSEEGTIMKHSRQAAKRHQVAESDRKDYLRVTSEHNNVKAAIKAMGTPDELHVNEGGIFEEDSNRLCSVEMCGTEAPSVIPWINQQNCDEKSPEIRQELQSMNSRIHEAAQKKDLRMKSDSLDLAFKTSTGGQSKYHFSRDVLQVPIESRVIFLETRVREEVTEAELYGTVVKQNKQKDKEIDNIVKDKDSESENEEPPPLPTRRPESFIHEVEGGAMIDSTTDLVNRLSVDGATKGGSALNSRQEENGVQGEVTQEDSDSGKDTYDGNSDINVN